MDKKHFLSLLYLLWVAPILFAVSSSLSQANTFFIFGLMNIILLLVFALIFSKLSTQKKSIGLAIIGWLLLLGVAFGWLYKLGEGASSRLYNRALAPDTQVMSGSTDTLSGESLSGDIMTGSILTTGIVLTGDTTPIYEPTSGTTTTIVENSIPADSDNVVVSPKPEVKPEPSYSTVLPAQGNLNYAQVIPYLVNTYKLKNTSGKSFNFNNITSSNILYSPFNTAASKSMIGETINPSSKVSCNTYLVLKGIASWWKVSYTGAPQAAYRAKALELGKVNNCKDGAFVTKSTL